MIEITATIICDKCGAIIVGPIATLTLATLGMESYWGAEKAAKQAGWIESLRYGKAKHFCSLCADRPISKKTKGKK